MADTAATTPEGRTMTPEDAERWKELERRARNRGWTIDLLAVDSGMTGGSIAGTPTGQRAFALVELHGNERALVTGDLDTIEAFLP
jgi:hypothetical protein